VVFDGEIAVNDPTNVQFRWLMAEEEDVNTGEEWLAGAVQDPQDCGRNADGHVECTVTFTPGDLEVDNLLRVEVTFMDDGGVLRSLKSPATTEMVVNVQDAPVPPVLSTQDPAVGQAVRASGLQDEDGLGEAGETLQWIWQVADPGSSTWTTVATNPFNITGFVPLPAHSGQRLRVVASYTDDHGTAENAASLPTNPITGPSDPGPSVPSAPFAGSAAVSGPASILVSWTPPVDDGGAAISGYTVSVYADGAALGTRSAGANATSAQVGNLDTDPTIAYTFRVAARNKAGTGAATTLMGPVSFPTPGQSPVVQPLVVQPPVVQPPVVQPPVVQPPVVQPPATQPAAVAVDGTPRLVGTAAVGARLRVRVPEVTTPGKAKVTFTWKVGGKRVKGATGKTYRIAATDRGKKIKVVLKIKQRGLKAIRVTTKPVRVRR
jgi:hypothetical protein